MVLLSVHGGFKKADSDDDVGQTSPGANTGQAWPQPASLDTWYCRSHNYKQTTHAHIFCHRSTDFYCVNTLKASGTWPIETISSMPASVHYAIRASIWLRSIFTSAPDTSYHGTGCVRHKHAYAPCAVGLAYFSNSSIVVKVIRKRCFGIQC